MQTIDTNFDYRLDSKSGDPDADSQLLYEVHELLWSKELPSKEYLSLSIINKKSSRILLSNNLVDNLSSDRMCPHLTENQKGKFGNWLSENDRIELNRVVRTIGGHIVFPAHRRVGFTINQSRGINKKIGDRFDLTLECIKRYYLNQESPISKSLKQYSDFFDLFVDFNSYTEFFLLDDFLDKDKKIKFSIPFDDFRRSPFPHNKEEYVYYKNHVIELINLRNNRIKNWIKENG